MDQAIGEAKCGGLRAFHALNRCDLTSSFAGKGKCTAWTAWDAYDDATSAMCPLSRIPTTESIMSVLPTIKRLIVIIYDRVSSDSSVNGERLVLFTQKGRDIENNPPTPDALALRVLRVGYGAGHVWGQATITDFVWTWEVASAQWNMKWMTLPHAGTACSAVITCGRIKGCRRECKCKKADLTCTMLCKWVDVNKTHCTCCARARGIKMYS